MKVRNVAESWEAEMELVRAAVYAKFAPGDGLIVDPCIMHIFDDGVIVKDWSAEGKYYELGYAKVDGSIMLGEPHEVSNMYVGKRIADGSPKVSLKDADERLELTGPIVMKNAAKRIAYAAVLVPGEPDHDSEVLSAERVEKAAHEWMESYRNVDLQHTLNNVGFPVESYLLPMEMTVKNVFTGENMTLPIGTWILGSKTDEQTWDKVESGELTGYSVMGIKKATGAGKGKNVAMKKTLLRDLGEDWIAAFVSFVDEPAVPKAKFFALKAREPEQKGFFKKVFEGIKPAEKEGRRFSKLTLTKMKELGGIITELLAAAEEEEENKNVKGGGNAMEKEEIMVLIKESLATSMAEVVAPAVKEAVAAAKEEILESMKPVVNPVEEAAAKEAVEAAEKEAAEKAAAEKAAAETFETFKAELNERLDRLDKKAGGSSSRAIKAAEEPGDKDQKAAGDIVRDVYGRRIK